MLESHVRTDLRSRWRSYLATVIALGLVAALTVWAIHGAGRPAPAQPPTAGFNPSWRCAPATDDHPVCWRELPPAAKRSPSAIPQDDPRPHAYGSTHPHHPYTVRNVTAVTQPKSARA